ncbi:MAG: hypothetical protein ACRC5U_08475 [Plesiomonas sp.]|uniref:hypothetical protein n=1 Tax=Plesiomonas sp. TaxID=2486279 RepID=UPI003F33A06F
MKDSLIALMLVALPVAAFASLSMNLHQQGREPMSQFQLQPEPTFDHAQRGDPVVRASSYR